jgi:hypothetical protein
MKLCAAQGRATASGGTTFKPPKHRSVRIRAALWMAVERSYGNVMFVEANLAMRHSFAMLTHSFLLRLCFHSPAC